MTPNPTLIHALPLSLLGNTVAPHQRECTCYVVGGSVHFIVSCSIIARPRISIRETTPFANISNRNAGPRIRRRMLFVVITLMRTLHAFDSGKANEIESLYCEASQSVAEKRRNNLHVVRRTLPYSFVYGDIICDERHMKCSRRSGRI